jgi:hypothetical protein
MTLNLRDEFTRDACGLTSLYTVPTEPLLPVWRSRCVPLPSCLPPELDHPS